MMELVWQHFMVVLLGKLELNFWDKDSHEIVFP